MSENVEPKASAPTVTSRQSSSGPAKRKAVGPVTILPLVKKYFKTVGWLAGVWIVGYFKFSITWLLIPPFFYILNEEYRKTKEERKAFARHAAEDEKSAILSRIDELPSWVFFPDVERAEWLNKMIKQMWPYIGEYVKGLLKTTVEQQVSNALPASLQPFRFEKIDLGDAPPRIGGVKVYVENIKRDEIIMDLEIFMASDTNIKVCVRGMNAGIKDLMVHGHLRCVMSLCNKLPIIGGLNVFFLNQPTVDFDLTNYANLLDMPLLSNSLRTVVQDQLNYYMVLPNKYPIQLVDGIDLQRLHYPMPQGVLRLHMVAARELKRADVKLIGKGKSDPYAKIYIGAQTFKTKVIENTINPVWNTYFEAVIDQKHGQFAEIEVLDEDPGEDDELGTAGVDIQNIAESGSVDTWLPLENVSTGMVHVRALWLHLSKDPQDLEKKMMDSVQSNHEQETKDVTEDHLSSALLMINIDSAKSLPKVFDKSSFGQKRDRSKLDRVRSKKSMSEPSPYVKLLLGNEVQKTVSKPKSTDPKWEDNFHFLVSDPRNQDLIIEVLDSSKKAKKMLDVSSKDKKLGTLTIPLRTLLTMPDMTVNRPYQLKESGPQSKLILRLCLRILSSETPEYWVQEVQPTEQEIDPKDVEKAPSGGKDKKEVVPSGEKLKKDDKKEAPSGGKEKNDVLSSELPEEWALDNPPPAEDISEETPAEPEDTKPDDTMPAKAVDEPAKPTSSTPDEAMPSGGEREMPVDVGVTEKTFTIGDGDTISNASSTFEQPGSELRHRNVGGSASDAGLGRLQLTLRYSTQRNRLIVVVHKCINLIPCDDDNLADPYVRMYLMPDRSSSSKKKTQVIKNNLNPIFDETFEWGLPLTEVKQRSVDIQVKNKNSMFSKARVNMGQVSIDLAQLDLTKAITDWYDLEEMEADEES